MIRLIWCLFALLLSPWATAAVTFNDQSINFGSVPFTTQPGLAGQAQVPITIIVNCTSGATLKIEPNAGSNGNMVVNMTKEGVPNGTQHVYFYSGSTLMKSSVPSSLINTTCTGTNQTINLTAVISGTTQPGTAVALNKAGIITFTGKLFKVTVGGSMSYSANQTISGSVDVNCLPPSVGNMSLGTIAAQATTNNQQVTTILRVTCDSGATYTIAGDSDSSTWNYNLGMCADLFSPPQPSNPALVCLKIKQSGAGSFQNLGVSNYLYPGVGTGSEQQYELQANVTIPANATGILHKVINIKIVF